MSDVHKLLRACDACFKSGDTALYSTATAELKVGVRDAKCVYTKTMEDSFTDHDAR